jgi:Uma2 family endonuclease
MTIWLSDGESVEYPTTDGEPMGETDIHRQLMVDLIEALQYHYRPRDDVYVSGNIMFYYEEGNPRAHLSPDVLVTPGIAKEPREIYKLWEIGKAPELIVEVTSRSTKFRDVGVKKGLYEAFGVQEYILFDPRAEYLQPRFQVFRLEQGLFVPCLAPEQAGYSSRLGLNFRVVGGTLRIFDSSSEQMLPTPQELALRAEQAQARAQAEHERAQAEHERAERLAQRLRELGVDPDL